MSHARKIHKPVQAWHLDLGLLTSPANSSCIGTGENLEPEAVLNYALESGVHHLCQKNGHMYNQEIATAECLIAEPESYLQFPAAAVLSPAHLDATSEQKLMLMDTRFSSSKEKQPVLEAAAKAMQDQGISKTVMDDVNAVADELFTNAIYNAPFVDLITHKNPGVSRQSPEVSLNGGKTARLILAKSEGRLLIGCQDPFGSLDLPKFLTRIKSVYERGPAATMNFGPGGAGIGSYIIFNMGASLTFGVWQGRATILCCVIPLGVSNRVRSEMPKHLHWIQQ